MTRISRSLRKTTPKRLSSNGVCQNFIFLICVVLSLVKWHWLHAGFQKKMLYNIIITTLNQVIHVPCCETKCKTNFALASPPPPTSVFPELASGVAPLVFCVAIIWNEIQSTANKAFIIKMDPARWKAAAVICREINVWVVCVLWYRWTWSMGASFGYRCCQFTLPYPADQIFLISQSEQWKRRRIWW